MHCSNNSKASLLTTVFDEPSGYGRIVRNNKNRFRNMRGTLETIVGAMFAGKTSELLKRILWAKHQNKKILVIKPIIDNRYAQEKIITHNDLSHDCFPMKNWDFFNDRRYRLLG